MHHLGATRSTSRRDYLLHTPDTFVRTPLPELVGGLAIVHAAPQMGAGFSMMTVELDAGGTLGQGPAQRFVYLLEGECSLAQPGATPTASLTNGGYAYLPAEEPWTLEAKSKARVVVIDKPYQLLPSAHVAGEPDETFPAFFSGHERDVAAAPLNGDDGLLVRPLMPASPAFDFAVNTMTYAPGASLAQVEIHYMEHGLLMLEGGGVYRLGDDWHPVQAGDAIWMGAFCPQWFGALGKTPAKYLIYKDFNRHVMA